MWRPGGEWRFGVPSMAAHALKAVAEGLQPPILPAPALAALPALAERMGRRSYSRGDVIEMTAALVSEGFPDQLVDHLEKAGILGPYPSRPEMLCMHTPRFSRRAAEDLALEPPRRNAGEDWTIGH